ncbi:uncharacterized protein LOC114841872 [Betta splendens]|uniref:Dual specificity phosphatase 29 n=1 Tax=Betta splendens TaxID=158456 RepID=A0A8M1HNE1_BETSP|nr:uncharacterized protein LOC114841872 [Betta splendens]
MQSENRMSLRDPPYAPPSVSDLQDFLLTDRRPTGHVNQVWPNLYIGNEAAARDKATLHSLGVTHIVNAAHGPTNLYVNTGPRFYRDMTVDYYGVEADDAIDFILSPFFYPTARYIKAALAMGGRVFVHCLMGVSRSAALVLAFLMIAEGLRLQEAVAAVRQHRDICPNPGFLQQLRSLDMSLERERRRRQQAQTLGHLAEEKGTLPLTELREILWTNRKPVAPVNQVWPNLYVGDESVARDKSALSSLGVTHVLNAAAGRHRINTSQQFYSDLGVEYYGVEAADHTEFDLRPFFRPAAQFIEGALGKNGKVFVHCAMGVSRSGALVLAYLMICQDLPLAEAIAAVRLNRDVGPNSGFLQQLRELELSIRFQSSQIREEGPHDMSSCALKARSKNPYTSVRVDPDSDYITPGTLELEQLFWNGTGAQYTHVNEVWPGVYIGDEKTALELEALRDLGVTHVLNAAEGKWNNVVTGADYYSDMDIQYYGVEADDTPSFNISQHFFPAAEFIHEALSFPQNKVLVHCVMGRSRSVTLVLAYLMTRHTLTVVDAIEHVRQRRCILPNHGFLKQLRALDITLQEERLRRKHDRITTNRS